MKNVLKHSITMDANPEGVNQWNSMSSHEKASVKTEQANTRSALANKSGEKHDHSNAASAHAQAKVMNRVAGKEAKERGDKKGAQEHLNQAHEHEMQQEYHTGMARK